MPAIVRHQKVHYLVGTILIILREVWLVFVFVAGWQINWFLLIQQRKRKLDANNVCPSKKQVPEDKNGANLSPHNTQNSPRGAGASGTPNSRGWPVIPTKDNPPPEMANWLAQFAKWSNAERLMALTELIARLVFFLCNQQNTKMNREIPVANRRKYDTWCKWLSPNSKEISFRYYRKSWRLKCCPFWSRAICC